MRRRLGDARYAVLSVAVVGVVVLTPDGRLTAAVGVLSNRGRYCPNTRRRPGAQVCIGLGAAVAGQAWRKWLRSRRDAALRPQEISSLGRDRHVQTHRAILALHPAGRELRRVPEFELNLYIRAHLDQSRLH